MTPDAFHRRSIRLPGYDYTQPGAYFVTLVAKNRLCLFGEIVDDEMQLNEVGEIVAQAWQWLARQYPYVDIDEWVIMPNHLHGVIWIVNNDAPGRGGSRTAPTHPIHPQKSLGRLIGAFKTVSTKQVNLLNQTPGAALWQRNYFEHVIRNDDDLRRICEYICNNPPRWALDRENPLCQSI